MSKLELPVHDPATRPEPVQATLAGIEKQYAAVATPDAEVQAFLDAGYRSEQVLDVLVGLMLKTLSNYTNHLAVTPLDSVFAARAFNPESK